jgi:hypothetical protein
LSVYIRRHLNSMNISYICRFYHIWNWRIFSVLCSVEYFLFYVVLNYPDWRTQPGKTCQVGPRCMAYIRGLTWLVLWHKGVAMCCPNRKLCGAPTYVFVKVPRIRFALRNTPLIFLICYVIDFWDMFDHSSYLKYFYKNHMFYYNFFEM